MIFRNMCGRFIACIILLILALLLVSCGGSDPDTILIEGPPPADTDGQGDNLDNDGAAQDPEFDTSMVQEVELPVNFPSSFPILEDAQISSDVSQPGENDFRVFLSMTLSIDEALAYYQRDLLLNDWTILEEQISDRGTEMVISSMEYDGELLFVDAEMGVALDVHLYPLGTGEEIPDLPSIFGDSETLGGNTSSFPSDFPIPSSYVPIELNETLRADGYELAFTYVGIAEMGMIDLNIALMSAGWELGELSPEGIGGVYIVPFVSPEDEFEGFAYITNNPGQFNLDTGGAVLIALSPGQP